MKTHIAINGAGGRMGQRLVALAKEDHELQVVAAVDAPTSPAQGRDSGEIAGIGHSGVPVTYDLPLTHKPDCVIDFSAPEGTMRFCRSASHGRSRRRCHHRAQRGPEKRSRPQRRQQSSSRRT